MLETLCETRDHKLSFRHRDRDHGIHAAVIISDKQSRRRARVPDGVIAASEFWDALRIAEKIPGAVDALAMSYFAED